jgi:arabinose-5-phosphate isomerase
MKNDLRDTGIKVIDLQIKALKKLKNSINKSFVEAVEIILKCKSKIIVCGVGKSGIIASKISATLSSVGTPSFTISASDCSHGDLGRITNKDILILISYSGNTFELKNIIKYARTNKIPLIGIVSNKNSELYKFSNVKLLIPEVLEAGYGIVPTSSTTIQLAIGDALAITLMQKKKFGKLDFKKFHPSGTLGKKLKTAGDLMLIGNKIPFVKEDALMKNALKILNSKKLGFIIAINKKGLTTGVFTDGDLKRLMQKKNLKINNLKLKTFMTKNPFMIEKNQLAIDILKQMNKRKITNVCVYQEDNKRKTVGALHIHNLIQNFKMNN